MDQLLANSQALQQQASRRVRKRREVLQTTPKHVANLERRMEGRHKEAQSCSKGPMEIRFRFGSGSRLPCELFANSRIARCLAHRHLSWVIGA